MNLVALGDLNLDVHVALPADPPLDDRPVVAGLPSGGGELRARIRITLGGAAATFARVASAEGAAVTLIACAGNDPAGRVLREGLTREGIRLLECRSLRSTGVVISTSMDGEGNRAHTMICDRGANDDLVAQVANQLEAGAVDHLHISGYAFLSSEQREAAHAVIDACRGDRVRSEVPISVDPPPAGLIRAHGRERFLADLRRVSMLFPNEEEALFLTSSNDVAIAIDALAARFRAGAVTLGARGAVVWNEGQQFHVAVDPLDGINVIGAGDAFAAGFVTALHGGASATEAGHRGAACAQRWLTQRSEAEDEEAS